MITDVQAITAKDWSPKLGVFGEIVTDIEDIAQCIRIICSTRLGEVPLEPEFGSEIFKWIDAPLDVARANIPVEIFRSIGRWEPRVIVTSVLVEYAKNMAGVVISIDWSLNLEGATAQTTLLTPADFGITAGAQQIIDETMAQAASGLDVQLSDYRNEFLDALNN